MVIFEFQASQLARAADDIAGILVTAKVDLFQIPIDISQGVPLADFVAGIADFVGYAQKTVTWLVPSVADDGTVEVVGLLTFWRPTNSVTPNNIFGFYITDTTAAILLFAALFDDGPLPMQSSADSIVLTLRYRPATNSIGVVVS